MRWLSTSHISKWAWNKVYYWHLNICLLPWSYILKSTKEAWKTSMTRQTWWRHFFPIINFSLFLVIFQQHPDYVFHNSTVVHPGLFVVLVLLDISFYEYVFVDRCLTFYPFSFGHCVVCSFIYIFWLPLCYHQTFLFTCLISGEIWQHTWYIFSPYLSSSLLLID